MKRYVAWEDFIHMKVPRTISIKVPEMDPDDRMVTLSDGKKVKITQWLAIVILQIMLELKCNLDEASELFHGLQEMTNIKLLDMPLDQFVKSAKWDVEELGLFIQKDNQLFEI